MAQAPGAVGYSRIFIRGRRSAAFYCLSKSINPFATSTDTSLTRDLVVDVHSLRAADDSAFRRFCSWAHCISNYAQITRFCDN